MSVGEHIEYFQELDHFLAEQDLVLDGLKTFLNQNAITQQEFDFKEQQLIRGDYEQY